MKKKEFLEMISTRTGLHMEEKSGILYGNKDGFDVLLIREKEYPYNLTLTFSALRSAGPLTKSECKELAKDHKGIGSVKQNQNSITVLLLARNSMEKNADSIDETLRVMTAWLREHDFENVCQRCGRNGESKACYVNGTSMLLCDECYNSLYQDTSMHTQQREQKRENLIGGIVGALVGSLIGAVFILLLGQLGYVAAASGIIMAVCTLKGYSLVGGKLTLRGIVISVLLMILMIYCAGRMDWAILVAKEFDVGIAQAYRSIPMLIQAEVIESSSYYVSLAQVYLFALVGGVPMVRSSLKAQKEEGHIYRMEESRNYEV